MIITMLCECNQGCREQIEIDSGILQRAIRSNYLVLSNYCPFGPGPELVIIEATSEYAIYRDMDKTLSEEIVTIPERLRPRLPSRFR